MLCSLCRQSCPHVPAHLGPVLHFKAQSLLGQPALQPVQAHPAHLRCSLQLDPGGDPHCKGLHLLSQGSPLCSPRSKLCLLGCLLLPLQPGPLSLPAGLLSLPAASDSLLISRGQLLGLLQPGLLCFPASVGHACHTIWCRATHRATLGDAGRNAAGLSAGSGSTPLKRRRELLLDPEAARFLIQGPISSRAHTALMVTPSAEPLRDAAAPAPSL